FPDLFGDKLGSPFVQDWKFYSEQRQSYPFALIASCEEYKLRKMVILNHSSSGTKKYRGSKSSDDGNTGDGVKTAGEVIGSGDEIEFSEELKELLSDEIEV
ncbi:hypothetical protein Tco_0944744, partial [Tanacetum coccineum]